MESTNLILNTGQKQFMGLYKETSSISPQLRHSVFEKPREEYKNCLFNATV
jgi:hypothetical protein